MTVRTPYQVNARTDPWWGERPPRGYTRQDRVDLNLFDAGHGDIAVTRNPILLGLGVTLKLRLNVFVRTWRVFVKDDLTGLDIDITSQFKRVADRMYELRGVAGAGAFNPAGRGGGDWGSPVELQFRVETTNVTLTSTFRATMVIQDADDIRSCPDACQVDFNLMKALHRQRVRLWRDVIEPGRQPVDTDHPHLIYLFDQAEQLKALSAELCGCFNYFSLVMIGVKFFRVGTCEESTLATAPNAADCNPWDGVTLPQTAGQDIILPAAWPTSGCP